MFPTPSDLQRYIPYYLTAERKKGLIEALKDQPSGRYYAKLDDPEPLQGDSWRNLQLLRFEDGKRDKVTGMLLTNSCDLAKDNSRLTVPNITFVPLVRLNAYLEMLQRSGKDHNRVKQHADDIRKQNVSDLFYLPAMTIDGPEYIAPLNNIHTLPISAFNSEPEKQRMFSLSDAGFYFFIFKLSVHFCRFHENIDRTGS